MPQLKTQKTDSNVLKFINSVNDKKRKDDALVLLDIMTNATKHEPKMWGNAIIGFGDYKLTYPNGRELNWFYAGFSPRKQNLVLYGVAHSEKLFKDPKKSKTGKGCIYINRIEDIDLKVLEKMVKEAMKKGKSEK